MRFILTLIIASLIIFSGCVVQPTKEGNMVRVVTEKESEGCEYLGLVTGSGSMGWTPAHDSEGALNEVRNRAAQLGANAILFITMDATIWGSSTSAKALKCKF